MNIVNLGLPGNLAAIGFLIPDGVDLGYGAFLIASTGAISGVINCPT
jgi:hypothetical protein